MKKFLFGVLIILLTPIYLIINCAFGIIEITQPIADSISDFVEDMVTFWRKIFKIKEEK